MTDRASVTAYEPGSVFKIFSVASFLDSKSITADDSFCATDFIKGGLPQEKQSE